MTTIADEAALLARYDPARAPAHIAVIMDGNGRWAQRRGQPRVAGHRAGAKAVRAVVDACDDFGVRHLTLYTFSVENWKRPRTEVRALMQLIEENLRREAAELHARHARVRAVGRLHELPASLQATLADIAALTADNEGLRLNLALNYGGRAEITDAARRLVEEALAGRLCADEITEQAVAARLYAPDTPDPDLMIRTAGEMRISNYLIWQAAYAELWVTDTLWPDFGRSHLLQAIVDYQRRDRKFGGLPGSR